MIIYLIRNTVNGKCYIGKTEHSAAARWRAHRSEAKRGGERYLCRAIRKYGVVAFEVSELCRADSLEQLNALEVLWIWVLRTTELGYNRTAGGDGGLVGEARARMAATKRGRPMSEEHKERIRQGVTGIRWSEEAKAHWKGHKKSPETAARIALWHRGRKMTEEQRKKLRVPHRLTPKLVAHLARLNSNKKEKV